MRKENFIPCHWELNPGHLAWADHWAMTTRQPLSLTILYVHFISSARKDVASISYLVHSYCDVASRISSLFQLCLKLGRHRYIMPHTIVSRSFVGDSGKIAQSSLRRNTEKSASLHSLRSLPTTTLSSHSMGRFGLGLATQDWYCPQLIDI